MKILQITSDWKWTGPAAPMLELLVALRARGCAVELACPPAEPGASSSLQAHAISAGAPPVLELSRARGVDWWRDRTDVRRLAELIREDGFDIVHAWHTRDHVLAIRAAAAHRRAGAPRIVRSYKSADAIKPWPWNRWLFGSATDALFCVSPHSAERNARLRRGRPLLGAFGAVDLTRFAPRPKDADLRAAFGIRPTDRVIGIVARVQRRRRFDLLLDAMRLLADDDEDARLLVIGRGTHLEEVAKLPAERLGISDRVVFAGFREADYADALRAADVFTILVPGSDGTCRALLEAAACGLPAVTTRRGALPEIVVDGETGLVVEEDPAALAGAWRRLLDDAPLRGQMGLAARRRAEAHFSPAGLARDAASLYERL